MKTARQGFTLIELLTVMAIMMTLAGAGVAAYFGITRGAAMRSGVAHLRSTLMLARQAALTQGRKTYVVFQGGPEATDGDPLGPGYYVCQKAGVGTGPMGAKFLVDEYANWQGTFAEGSAIFNLSKSKRSVVTNEPHIDSISSSWVLETVDPIWSASGNDTYGWEINAKTYLPRGIQFGNGSPLVPPTVVFNGDGTTASGGYKIKIYEEINPAYVPVVTVEPLTGLIEVEMP